ncbi:doublesex cognate 73A [Anopheles darlingi]|uniref:Doublesex cognate 73A n=1 Tax=Anopheles darlingi TaxID=43151 RepID=W5J6K7_ANODA|nr:doublesex cognate 73A [Anopheles darlingi]
MADMNHLANSYRDPCSASLNEDDNHTIKLVGNQQKRAITLAKTCENTNELRDCRAPKDWSILALQNTRTGKSHYLVICKCPPHYRLEGPLAHDQPTYAGLPGINVYGMLCVPPETSSYYASKPAKTPANVYNKWKIPSRQPVSSYRGSAAGANVDAETESESRTYQNSTDTSAAGSEE